MPNKKTRSKTSFKKNEHLKQEYSHPIIEIYVVKLDFDVAITSTRIRIGGENENTPKVDEWEDSDGKTFNVDF